MSTAASLGIDPALQACLAAAGDETLSLAAKGLLLTYLARPELREAGTAELGRILSAEAAAAGRPKRGCGRESAAGLLRELERAGYASRSQVRGDDNTWGASTVDVHPPRAGE